MISYIAFFKAMSLANIINGRILRNDFIFIIICSILIICILMYKIVKKEKILPFIREYAVIFIPALIFWYAFNAGNILITLGALVFMFALQIYPEKLGMRKK